MANTKSSYGVNKWIHTIIVFALMFGFRFVPAPAPMTETGMAVIGVFAGAIWGWIFIDIGWPSILGIFALGTTSYTTMTDQLANVFGSQNAVLIMGLLIVTAFIECENISPIISQWLLTRKISKNRPYLTVFFFLLACFFTSLLGYANAAVLVFIELTRSMSKATGMKPHSRQMAVFMCAFPVAVTLGDTALPFKTSAIIAMTTYSSVTGTEMSASKFTAFAFPICILLLAAYCLICKFVLRIDMSCLKGYEVADADRVEITTRKKVSLVATIIVLVLLVVPSIMPDCGVKTFLSGIGLGGLVLMLLVILSLVRVEGKPLIDVGTLAAHFKWKVFFLAAFIMPTAGALVSDATGVKAFVSENLQGLTSGMPLIVFAIFALVGTWVFTNFCNNVVISAIFISLTCVMSATLPALCVPALCVCIALTSDFACCLPSACPPAAICYSQKDMVSFKEMSLHGLLSMVSLIVIMLVVAYPYANLIFG